MTHWKIFYSDGSAVSSEDYEPEDVPGFQVEAIAQPDRTPGTGNVGYVVIAGWDWYYWRTDSEYWYGARNDRSILDLIRLREPIVGASSGLQIPDERYESILAEARAWADAQGLPDKSGFRQDERL